MTPKLPTIWISGEGELRSLYQEAVDLSTLGKTEIRRVSHVEPDELGQWWADLSPIEGPRLGPYAQRSLALDAEVQFIQERLAQLA